MHCFLNIYLSSGRKLHCLCNICLWFKENLAYFLSLHVSVCAASVKSEKPLTPAAQSTTPAPPAPPPSASQPEPQPPKQPSRHLIYSTHFPIPQDEYSSHECNQRLVTLYGVGKARDDARDILKKIRKEIMKLYSKKNSLDTSSGDIAKGKKKKEKEKGMETDSSTNFESTFNKFQKLSYYDQHAVTSSCACAVLEAINSFAVGNSSYLPLVENISYLFDLMEYALNISGLLDFVIQVSLFVREITEVLKMAPVSLM